MKRNNILWRLEDKIWRKNILWYRDFKYWNYKRNLRRVANFIKANKLYPVRIDESLLDVWNKKV